MDKSKNSKLCYQKKKEEERGKKPRKCARPRAHFFIGDHSTRSASPLAAGSSAGTLLPF